RPGRRADHVAPVHEQGPLVPAEKPGLWHRASDRLAGLGAACAPHRADRRAGGAVARPPGDDDGRGDPCRNRPHADLSRADRGWVALALMPALALSYSEESYLA